MANLTIVVRGRDVSYNPVPVGILFIPNQKGGGLVGFYRTTEGTLVVFPHDNYVEYFRVGELNAVLLPTDERGNIPKGFKLLVAVPVSVLFQ